MEAVNNELHIGKFCHWHKKKQGIRGRERERLLKICQDSFNY